MTEGFLNGLWRMSCQAGIAVCIVLAVRILFTGSKVPKKYTYMLWGIPFLRMLIPWWAESPYSIFSAMEGVEKQLSGIFAVADAALSKPVRGMLELSGTRIFFGQGFSGTRFSPRQALSGTKDFFREGIEDAHTGFPAASMLLFLWAAGVLGLLVYCTLSFLKIKRQVKCGTCLYENIYLADYIASPFVFGLARPRIYLPSDMEKGDMQVVILHEQVHIRRGDYLLKLMAFFGAACHWFNPLCWIGFYCMCRDMEMSCDEAVIGRMGESGRKEYAMTLLRMTVAGTGRRGIPLAFSLGNPKGRIRHIMGYRKAAGLTVVIGVVSLALLAAVLLTNPRSALVGGEGEGDGTASSSVPQTSSAHGETAGGASGVVMPKAVWTLPASGEEGNVSSEKERTEAIGSQTIFSYNGKDYEVSERASSVNAIVDCTEVGHYIIVDGHIGPHNGYYGIFNTVTEEFEKDIFGALLTYEAGLGEEADVDLSDFVYCFWNDIYDGNGNLLASCQIGEMEQIYRLRVEDGEIYADVLDIEAGEVVRTEKFTRQ